MNGAADENRLMTAFDNTQKLYEKTFGYSMQRDDFLQSFDNSSDPEINIG